MSEFAYMGRTDGGDTKVSFQVFAPTSQAWASYYLDLAAVTGDPESAVGEEIRSCWL